MEPAPSKGSSCSLLEMPKGMVVVWGPPPQGRQGHYSTLRCAALLAVKSCCVIARLCRGWAGLLVRLYFRR